jgi:hypothetical protein
VDGGVSRDHERFPVDVEDQIAMTKAAHQSLERVIDPTRRAPFHEIGIPAISAPGMGTRKRRGASPHLPTDTVDQLDLGCLRTASVLALAFIDAAQKYGLGVPSQTP